MSDLLFLQYHLQLVVELAYVKQYLTHIPSGKSRSW
jgi:hypothetical protein